MKKMNAKMFGCTFCICYFDTVINMVIKYLILKQWYPYYASYQFRLQV